jgi:hypothetical protein
MEISPAPMAGARTARFSAGEKRGCPPADAEMCCQNDIVQLALIFSI